MTDTPNNTSLSTRIAEILTETNPSMRPRWYFVLLGALTTTGILLLVCLTLFLMSFVFFFIHQESIDFVPTFGLAGAVTVLFSLPWIIIFLIILFVIALELFLRHISFAYRRPLIYSLAAVIILTVFGGLAIAKTELHEALMEQAERSAIPLIKPLYRHYKEQPPSDSLSWGRILSTTTEGFILEHPERKPLLVIVTEQTKLAPHTYITPGMIVSVFGRQIDDHVEARGIRLIPKPADKEKKFQMK